MINKWYRLDFLETRGRVIAQVEAKSEQEAIGIVEAAHPESRYYRMLSITGPTDGPEHFQMIGNLSAGSHPWIEYINTFESL